MKKVTVYQVLYRLVVVAELALLIYLLFGMRSDAVHMAKPQMMTAQETEKVRAYAIESNAAKILAHATPLEVKEEYTTYSAVSLAQELVQCEMLREVASIGEGVTVSYSTTEGYEVALNFDDAGLTYLSLYTPGNDTYYEMIKQEEGQLARKYENLRYGQDWTPWIAVAIALGAVLLLLPLLRRASTSRKRGEEGQGPVIHTPQSHSGE